MDFIVVLILRFPRVLAGLTIMVLAVSYPWRATGVLLALAGLIWIVCRSSKQIAPRQESRQAAARSQAQTRGG